jgi:hypothetical protein
MIKEERLRAYQNALDLDARAPLPKSQYKELLKTFHVDVILESHLLNCEFREEGGERIGILEGNLRIIDRDGSRAILPFQCKTPIAPNAGSPAQELVRRTVESLIEKLDVRQSFF